MNDNLRKKFLDESHERAVRQAMSDATDDLIRRRKETEKQEKQTIESRIEKIEKRLELLESAK
ncbi:MAG: hypothetical protein LBQ50_05965 [Planctomycetaceae bacterium]|jgi:hypothetical protein|nr:hypothetical protein [Planctomycetaceae bacterium]